ncbi:hypothetical protein [Burkholderia stagnalis]|uniref:hypothetical protein n=1 Tax=Burkholderia stagnalis TaxID=1503054 RepID=UPI0012DB64A7|nr:hypothetical protein [Burkholderia stagnalis]
MLTLDVARFGKYSRARDGLKPHCRDCVRATKRALYEKRLTTLLGDVRDTTDDPHRLIACKCCGVTLRVSSYSRDLHSVNGRKTECKACLARKSLAHYHRTKATLPPKDPARRRAWSQARRDALTDGEVRRALVRRSTLAPDQIPDDLVAAKREQIKLSRYLKEISIEEHP